MVVVDQDQDEVVPEEAVEGMVAVVVWVDASENPVEAGRWRKLLLSVETVYNA